MEYKNKKSIILLPTLMAITLIGGYLLGHYTNPKYLSSQKESDIIERLSKLKKGKSNTKISEVISLIDSKYVDSISVDTLTEEYIPKILKKLDPHSLYIPVQDAVSSNEHLEGEFDGIGVMFNMATDTVIIQNVISGGPSEKAGVLAGDRIIMIDDSLVAGKKINQNDIVKKLKGKKETSVKISVERKGAKDLMDFNIVRDAIPIKSIDAAYMVAPRIGYIKLLQFSRNTHKEFTEAVIKLRSEGMLQLIFDLTGNSGGYLDQAILIANEFLPKERLIVYTEGSKVETSEQYSDGKGKLYDQDVILMVDEGSASSSEIVAGALQDNDKGVIVGRRTFGKGLVQQQMTLSDGSLVNITIARYHTPTGRCIQRSYENGVDEYYKDYYNRYLDGEMLSADSIKFPDSLKYTTPKGKVVYGGGGIMPDVFIPMDTTKISKQVRDLIVNNILFKYTLKYTDDNRPSLQGLVNIQDLDKYFESNWNKIWQGFVSYAASNGVKDLNSINKNDKKIIEAQIKAYISRNSSDKDNGFFYYFNSFDDIFNKSLNIAEEKVNIMLQRK